VSTREDIEDDAREEAWEQRRARRAFVAGHHPRATNATEVPETDEQDEHDESEAEV
jgi:hypothetical protein